MKQKNKPDGLVDRRAADGARTDDTLCPCISLSRGLRLQGCRRSSSSTTKLNDRLTTQQGTFLCPADLGSTFVDNLMAMDGWDSEGNVVKLKFKLADQETRTFAKNLKLMNLGFEALFPWFRRVRPFDWPEHCPLPRTRRGKGRITKFVVNRCSRDARSGVCESGECGGHSWEGVNGWDAMPFDARNMDVENRPARHRAALSSMGAYVAENRHTRGARSRKKGRLESRPLCYSFGRVGLLCEPRSPFKIIRR